MLPCIFVSDEKGDNDAALISLMISALRLEKKGI